MKLCPNALPISIEVSVSLHLEQCAVFVPSTVQVALPSGIYSPHEWCPNGSGPYSCQHFVHIARCVQVAIPPLWDSLILYLHSLHVK